jgi:dihydrodipicolinate synthase/N-acetylneuraminate lyase
MRTQRLHPADYAKSVVAVPPLALTPELDVNAAANATLIRHIEQGGVSILLYGGNANLYHIDLGRFRDLLGLLVESAGPDTAIIPSIGPDFGKMIDEAPILREFGIPDVMVLPTAFPVDADGIERGLKVVTEKLGMGVVLYIKRENYIEPKRLEKLIAGGQVRFVKYAVERAEPEKDAYLDGLISAIGRENMASGMGETPLPAHLGKDKLATFTSGGVCIAPAAAMALLRAYKTENIEEAERIRAPFLRFEEVRSRVGGIRVLHDAVTASGIADMGPILPLLSNVPEAEMPAVRTVTQGLEAIEAEFRIESRRSAA